MSTDTPTAHPTTEREWLEARLGGIGASETSAIMGLSSFASPWSVWTRKVQRTVDEPNDELQEMRDAGHRHEPSIRLWFSGHAEANVSVRNAYGVNKWDVCDLGEYHMDWSKEIPHLFCTTDAAIRSNDGINYGKRLGNLEIKCAWFKAAKGWEERLPLGYQCQGQHQMFCTDTETMFFAVELDGYRMKFFRLDRHESFIRKKMLPTLEKFWGCVTDGVPPPSDFHGSTGKAIGDFYDQPNGQAIEMPAEAEQWVDWWNTAKADEKDAKRRKDGAANKLKAALGNNEVGRLPAGDKGVSWRPDKNGKRTLRECKLEMTE